MGTTVYDPMDLLVINGPGDIFAFLFLVIVLVKLEVSNGVNIDMLRDSRGWLPIMVMMMISVFGKGRVQFFQLIERLAAVIFYLPS